MKTFHCSKKASLQGNIILFAVLIVAFLLVMAAHVFKNVFPRYVTTVQTASWQEARIAAEAGLNIGLAALNSNLPDPVNGNWNGWACSSGTVSTTTLSSSDSAIYSGSNSVGYVSVPIFLNSTLPSNSGSTFVDVQIRALYPNSTSIDPRTTSFKIRAMGTSTLGTPSRLAVDRMDSTLRRLSLFSGNGRVAITGTDIWGTGNGPNTLNPSTSTQPFVPYAARIVEAIVTPNVNQPFRYAVYTQDPLSLPNSNNYKFVSWDSAVQGGTPPSGSPVPDGDPDYATSPHQHADIGANSNATPAISIPKSPEVYGDIVIAQGGTVDNPSGYTGTLKNKNETFPLIPSPSTFGWLPVPHSGAMTISGKTRYHAASDPGNLSISGTGSVTIVIDSGWSPSVVTVAPTVTATLYVNGSLNFGNGSINASGVPGNLIIIGTAPASTNPSAFNTNGNPEVSAVFYGPAYSISWKGGGNGFFRGSVIAKSYSMSGGGASSFFYDEAASKIILSDPTGYTVSSYFEDSRQ